MGEAVIITAVAIVVSGLVVVLAASVLCVATSSCAWRALALLGLLITGAVRRDRPQSPQIWLQLQPPQPPWLHDLDKWLNLREPHQFPLCKMGAIILTI